MQVYIPYMDPMGYKLDVFFYFSFIVSFPLYKSKIRPFQTPNHFPRLEVMCVTVVTRTTRSRNVVLMDWFAVPMVPTSSIVARWAWARPAK